MPAGINPAATESRRYVEGVDVPEKSDPELSPRELQLLAGIVTAKTYPQIAYDLGLSLETIKTYAARLRAKLGVDTKVGLALWAAKHLKDVPACGPR